MHRSLAQIILHVALESDDLDVVAPVLLQVRPGFFVDGADEPELGVLQVEPVPGFQQMMNSFAFDQRSRKYRAENRWTHPWLEPFHVHAPRKIIKLFF